MKRVLIASILGLAASVASSYGQWWQANFFFDTYIASPDYPVTWTTDASLAPGGEAGNAVWNSEGFVADILWVYTIGANTYKGDAGVTEPLFDSPGYGPGWISGSDQLNGGVMSTARTYYVDNTPIAFTIEVWQGASWANATAEGYLTWTETQYQDGAPPLPFAAMTGPIYVALIPEPSTFALAGLGAAALLIFRKPQ